MIDRFRKLGWRRLLILAAAVVATPFVAFAQFVLLTGSVFEGGQKFGIVVTSWTLLILAAALAWKAAR
jgi:hypothetical protein